MCYRAGDRLYFLGYEHLPPDIDPIFHKADIVVVVAVRAEGELSCFPLDDWGRIYSLQGDTVFESEVLRLPLPRIPISRLPPPYGHGEIVEVNWRWPTA